MALNPGDLLTPRYDMTMMVWSFLIATAGSFLALECARLLRRKDGTLDAAMVVGSAVMLGGVAIWSMHFVGMQAYRVDVPISYDGFLTVLSLVAAIVIAGLALYLSGGSGKFNARGWFAGGVIAGLGVCVMHYMGMYAQVMPALMTLDVSIVLISVVIAITAALEALWMAFNVEQRALRLGAAVTMGIAVCAMHYTGMEAATLICIAAAPSADFTISSSHLFEWTLGVALLPMVLVSMMLFTRLKNIGQPSINPARA
ncbi:MAG: MHYT domain-containing protein [Burkholderiaceae bacterium]